MHTILKVFPTWRICRFETYKFWSYLAIQLHYYRLLPTPYTCRLAVCQQVPTEMDRKKETPTHSSSLFNEFESNSPFSFFFLIPLYIFRISSVFINKVLKWFDGLNLSLFFHNHFTSFTFQKRTLLKCLNIFSSLAVSVNDHVFNQRGNLSQLLSNFHSEFAKIWHEDIRCYSFMVPGYLYCCFY
jgi:hypothetical protein